MVDTSTVLAVDDDPDILGLISSFLSDEFSVMLAADGETAIRLAGQADVMLLDRKMPGMTGREVLQKLRENDNDIPVAMVTGVEPDFDIVDMGFDDYLVKPFRQGELRATVRNLIKSVEYDNVVREYFSLVSKLATLETEKTEDELANSDEYSHLKDHLEEVKTDARDALNESIDDGNFATLFARIDL